MQRTLAVGGKDNCAAGLQFYWFGFYQTRKYVVICMYSNYRIQTSQAGYQFYSELTPTLSVFRPFLINNSILQQIKVIKFI